MDSAVRRKLDSFLVENDELTALNTRLGRLNILRVLRCERTEIRHSNVLAWLLDPAGGHPVTHACHDDAVGRFVREVEWRFAKTMPRWPHWYVMKHWNPGREAAFMELVRRIFEEGHDEEWGEGTLRRTVRYYYLGDHKYWAMDPTIEETDLVNRARLDGKGPSDGVLA